MAHKNAPIIISKYIALQLIRNQMKLDIQRV